MNIYALNKIRGYRICTVLLVIINITAAAQPCSDSAYRIRYFSGKNLFFQTDVTTSDSGKIYMNNFNEPLAIPNNLYLIKTKKDGSVQWAKNYQTITEKQFYPLNLLQLKNGNIAVCGQLYETESQATSKCYFYTGLFSQNGNIIWQKKMEISACSSVNGDIRSGNIEEGNNGDLFFAYTFYASNPCNSVSINIVNTDINGNIRWSKTISPVNFDTGDAINITGIFNENTRINVLLTIETFFPDELHCGINNFRAIIGLQFDYTTGNILKNKLFCHPDIPFPTFQFTRTNGNNMNNSFRVAPNKYCTAETMMEEFNITNRLSSLSFFDTALNNTGGFILTKNNITDNLFASKFYGRPGSDSLYFLFQSGISSLYNIYHGIINTNGQIIKEKYFTNYATTNSLWGTGNELLKTSPPGQNDILDVYYNFTLNGNFFFEKIHFPNNFYNINSDCLGRDTSVLNVSDFNLTASDWNSYTQFSNQITVSDINLVETDFPVSSELICNEKSICDSVKISGNDIVCTGSVYRYKGLKNIQCLNAIKWQIDTSAINRFTILNDSTLEICFRREWQGYLYASINSCTQEKDSLFITANIPGIAPDLGKDTSICNGEQILLNTGSRYKTYQWQDNSTDSVFIANIPGLYYVRTTDFCGNRFSDTINIALSSTAFNLGPDEVLCIKDTLKREVSNKIINCFFQPDNSIQLYNHQLLFYPSTSTQYQITAETINGCYLSDTILIAIKNCLNKLLFPSAFTPNDDGLNDRFKPLVQGPVKSYELKIYSRWGQLIFRSNDPSSGWNGNYMGIQQNSGVFAWVCTYQFENEPPKTIKGTVTLIR